MDLKVFRSEFSAKEGLCIQELLNLGGGFKCGYARFPAGGILPHDGLGVHDHDEVCIIFKGHLTVESDSESLDLSLGDVALIPRGTYHRSVVPKDQDCELFWFAVSN